MNQTEIIEGIREERERLIAYLEKLPPEAWACETVCPGWTVKEVVAHLVGNVSDVLAQRLDGAGSDAYNQRQVDERAGADSNRILAEWKEKGPQLDAFFGGIPTDFWDSPIPDFGTVGTGVQRLLEDLWVHAQDVRTAVGDGAEPGPGMLATLEVVARESLERFRRLSPAPSLVEISAGDFRASLAVGGNGPEVRVEGEPVALSFAGTGRLVLDRARAEGTILVEPDPPAGFADALNIYGP